MKPAGIIQKIILACLVVFCGFIIAGSFYSLLNKPYGANISEAPSRNNVFSNGINVLSTATITPKLVVYGDGNTSTIYGGITTTIGGSFQVGTTNTLVANLATSRVYINNANGLADLNVGNGSDLAQVGAPTFYATKNGQIDFSIRDSTNDVEARWTCFSGGCLQGTFTSHAYLFRTNNATRMLIDPFGRVGVGAVTSFQPGDGTTVANAQLHVVTTTEQLRIGTTATSSIASFVVNSSGDLTVSTTRDFYFLPVGLDVLPGLHNTINLGSNTNAWKDLFVSGTARISGDLTIDGDFIRTHIDQLGAYSTTSLSIGTSFKQITFDHTNVAGDFSLSSQVTTTIPHSGNYSILLKMFIYKTAGVSEKVEMATFKNGVLLTESNGANICNAEQDVVNNNQTQEIIISCIGVFTQGDLVEFKVISSGTNAVIDTTGSNVPNASNRFLRIIRL